MTALAAAFATWALLCAALGVPLACARFIRWAFIGPAPVAPRRIRRRFLQAA